MLSNKGISYNNRVYINMRISSVIILTWRLGSRAFLLNGWLSSRPGHTLETA